MMPTSQVLVPEHHGWAAIDFNQRYGQWPWRFGYHAQPEARHGVLAVDRMEIRPHFAATIRPGDSILCQHAGQRRHVSCLAGGKKAKQ